MAKLNDYEQDQINADRELSVYKSDEMIQKARFDLTKQEQKSILYAISKIKPDDTHLKEYDFDIKDFYRLCGIEKDTYTVLKGILEKLSDRGWWLTMPDGSESRVRWFDVCRVNKNSGTVTIGFHKDMMPFLLQVAEQGKFFTSYNLKYVLPMKSKHSPRLYEILKSYQKNNLHWFFDIDKLKKLMGCESYKNFTDFNRFVLKPAVKEINEFSDLSIVYKEQREGRRVSRVIFYMDGKTDKELLETWHHIQEDLDGQVDLFDILMASKDDVGAQFMKERGELHREERRQKEEQKARIKSWLDPEE